MALTENRLRTLKPKDKSYKVADHRGLYIEVTPSGGKLWRFRYRIGNVEKKLAIGPCPEINLKQARNAADAARHSVAEGGDPAFEKRKKKIRDEFLSAQTFEAVAREYIEQMMVKNGLAQATLVKANYFLEQFTPAIGNRPIHEIEPFEVLAPLKRLEATGKHETAKKCRSFAGRVFRYGVVTTRCKSDPTAMLKGALVTPRAQHYAAILEPKELGGLLRAIDDYTGYSKEELTAHGLRATASTFLNESGLWNPDAIERALAHDHPQLAAEPVLIALANHPELEGTSIEQLNQAIGRPHSELVLAVALRLSDLRRIDVSDADLDPIEPKSVAIHHAGPPDRAANAELCRGPSTDEGCALGRRLEGQRSRLGDGAEPGYRQSPSGGEDRKQAQTQEHSLSQFDLPPM